MDQRKGRTAPQRSEQGVAGETAATRAGRAGALDICSRNRRVEGNVGDVDGEVAVTIVERLQAR